MPTVEELVSDLERRSLSYVPGPEIFESIPTHTIVPIIGPFAVGKTEVIWEIDANIEDFGRTKGFTTRPRRPDGEPADNYYWRNHDVEDLTRIRNQVRDRKLVQFAVHPETGHVYGTGDASYKTPHVVIDTLASAAESMNKLPFEVVEIGLVTPPNQWERQVFGRSQIMSEKELDQRLKEAAFSLRWLLDQGTRYNWVVNYRDQVPETAKEIAGIVVGECAPNPLSRHVGELLLDTVNELMAA
jgi:guanylate kinase